MPETLEALLDLKVKPRKGAEDALSPTEINDLLALIPGWALSADSRMISRDFAFKNYFHTVAFVNAVAFIAHQDDHHPDMEVAYSHCQVRFSTHDVGGLSLNDFICAGKVSRLGALG
jgi:4a-hydroxytetrahydrobiopterin dehydratase